MAGPSPHSWTLALWPDPHCGQTLALAGPWPHGWTLALARPSPWPDPGPMAGPWPHGRAGGGAGGFISVIPAL